MILIIMFYYNIITVVLINMVVFMDIHNDRKVETSHINNQNSLNSGVQPQGKLNGKKVGNLASFFLGKKIHKTIQKEEAASQRQLDAAANLKDTAKKLVELVEAGKLTPHEGIETLDRNINKIIVKHKIATLDSQVENNKLHKLLTVGLVLVGKFSKAKDVYSKVLDKGGLQKNIDEQSRMKKRLIEFAINEERDKLGNLAKAKAKSEEEVESEEEIVEESPSTEPESLMDRLNKLTNNDQKP